MPRWVNRPEGSNWGDFGPDDQIGRMNWLTPERRLGGVREVTEGIAFSLSLPLDYPGGQLVPFRAPPRLFGARDADCCQYNHVWDGREEITCDDYVVLHTQYSTQWDSLAHHGRLFDADGDGVAEKVYYNGYRADEHLVGPGADGAVQARALGIETLAVAGVQGRGVMINLHAAFGMNARPVGYDDLMRVIDDQRVEVRKGDFALFYSGFDRLLLDMNRQPDQAVLMSHCAMIDGSDQRLCQWVVDSGVVALCSDTMAVEWLGNFGSPDPDVPGVPLHDLCLFKQGIFLGEMWYLEELAHWLLAHRRSAFLLTAPPLRLPGSVGSPLTAIATV